MLLKEKEMESSACMNPAGQKSNKAEAIFLKTQISKTHNNNNNNNKTKQNKTPHTKQQQIGDYAMVTFTSLDAYNACLQ